MGQVLGLLLVARPKILRAAAILAAIAVCAPGGAEGSVAVQLATPQSKGPAVSAAAQPSAENSQTATKRGEGAEQTNPTQSQPTQGQQTQTNQTQVNPAQTNQTQINQAPRATGTALGPPALTIPRLQRAPALEDFVTMAPQGEIALEMAKVTGFTQRTPHDGEAVSEPTDAYLGYDQKNLYVVFVCFDDPGKVRARMSPREDIFDDDQVEVILDTFQDRRRAYMFQTTPLGVQWDAIWTEAARQEVGGLNYDTSFDTVWNSRGKMTSRGFVVWLAIPFKSLRFPSTKQQVWGIILYRGIRRNNEDAFWPYISRRIQGRLGQEATLYGLEGISPGHSIELIPYGLMRGYRALDTRDPTNPYFQHADAQGQPGMDAKFVFRDHYTLDLTANPDFSQVESEDPQITVNQRYAVYFPEKRPFFLENEDFFRTPMDLLFTRNIADPSAGVRLTGKDGPYSVGLLAADDRSPGLAVPDNSPLSGMRSYFTVARMSRDIFKQSSVGAIYTNWECPTTGEYNRVGGVDTRLKLTPTWMFEGQAVDASSKLNLNCEANLYPFSSGNEGNGSYYAGPAENLELQRDGLHLAYDGTYSDITPGFVTVPGFVNRVDIRETMQSARYRFRPKNSWVLTWGPSVNVRYDFDHTGLRLDTDYTPYFSLWGRGGTLFIFRPYEENRERLRPKDFCFLGYAMYCSAPNPGNMDYHQRMMGMNFQTQYLKKVTVAARYYFGSQANFVAAPAIPPALPTAYNQPFLAHEDEAQASLTFRPMTQLKIQNSYLFERLRATDGAYQYAQLQFPGAGRGIFNNHIVRTKVNWQFTPQLSMRVILQYNSLLAGTPGVGSPYTYLPTQKEFNADFLVTYLVHPGTAVYVGYNSDLQNLDVVPGEGVLATSRGYINDSRQWFVKVSYMLRF